MAKRERVIDAQERVGESALVSIITINYNQAELTRQFLNSSTALTYPNYEIILIDNGSVQPLSNSVDLSQYPSVRLFRSDTNLGFTGGTIWVFRKRKEIIILSSITIRNCLPRLLMNC